MFRPSWHARRVAEGCKIVQHDRDLLMSWAVFATINSQRMHIIPLGIGVLTKPMQNRSQRGAVPSYRQGVRGAALQPQFQTLAGILDCACEALARVFQPTQIVIKICAKELLFCSSHALRAVSQSQTIA